MRAWLIAILVVAGILTIGAAADYISRQEFTALNNRVVMLEIQVKHLTKPQANPVALQPNQPAAQMVPGPNVPQPPAIPAEPLTGRDLLAWKLARDAALQNRSDYINALGGRLDTDSIGVFDAGLPTADTMQKTETGDYIFSFYSYRPQTNIVKARISVHITDYGSEMRVTKVASHY